MNLLRLLFNTQVKSGSGNTYIALIKGNDCCIYNHIIYLWGINENPNNTKPFKIIVVPLDQSIEETLSYMDMKPLTFKEKIKYLFC